jgi:hypothetical protein
MPKPRTPTAKAAVSGAALKHPERYRARKSPTGTSDIGAPFPLMTQAEKEIWNEFVRDLPWLNGSHRVLLRLTCKLAARLDDETLGVNASQALSSLLSKLGATPVDESRVSSAGGNEDDPDHYGKPWDSYAFAHC